MAFVVHVCVSDSRTPTPSPNGCSCRAAVTSCQLPLAVHRRRSHRSDAIMRPRMCDHFARQNPVNGLAVPGRARANRRVSWHLDISQMLSPGTSWKCICYWCCVQIAFATENTDRQEVKSGKTSNEIQTTFRANRVGHTRTNEFMCNNGFVCSDKLTLCPGNVY